MAKSVEGDIWIKDDAICIVQKGDDGDLYILSLNVPEDEKEKAEYAKNHYQYWKMDKSRLRLGGWWQPNPDKALSHVGYTKIGNLNNLAAIANKLIKG